MIFETLKNKCKTGKWEVECGINKDNFNAGSTCATEESMNDVLTTTTFIMDQTWCQKMKWTFVCRTLRQTWVHGFIARD